MRRVLVVAASLLLAGGANAMAQGFVAPQPEGAAQRASEGKPARISTTKRRAPAPTSACEQMTKDWVDHRPIIDAPVQTGVITQDQLIAAINECEAEQVRQPGNIHVAFVFARTLEMNGRSTRAMALFQQLADAGYKPAITQIARAYYIGAGMPRNMYQACTRYVTAAKGGDAWAYNGAADCLSFQDFTHDPRLACFYFQKAQSSGTLQTADLTRADYCQ